MTHLSCGADGTQFNQASIFECNRRGAGIIPLT